MAEPDKRPVTMEELLVSSLAQTDALAKLLIEKGLITREEFMHKISEERTTYQKLFNTTQQRLESRPLRTIVVAVNQQLLIHRACFLPSPRFFAIFRPLWLRSTS